MSMFRKYRFADGDGQLLPESWTRRNFPPSEFAIECGGGRTKQEFRDECDINVLMARYERSGVLPTARLSNPFYVDAADLPDYQASLQLVRDAHESFEALPARVRSEFDNDPEKFVAFASDPKNKDQMRDWGLGRPVEPEPSVQRVEIVNPSAAPAQP